MGSINGSWKEGQEAVPASPSSCKRKKRIVAEEPNLKSNVDEALKESDEHDECILLDDKNSTESDRRKKCCSIDRGARNKVRETLRLFQAYTRKLLQEAERNPKEKKKDKGRIDRRAALKVKEQGKYVNTGESIIGPVPGVEVGDEFRFRVELMMIGLHRPSMNGIDYVEVGNRILATSVVDSGGYNNSADCYDTWVYTGQGVNTEDQKLEGGNLALKNSADEKTLVRVIQGVKKRNAVKNAARGTPRESRKYTYYGLYTVERYWQEIGSKGKSEYKFELKRVDGQPELAWKEIIKSEKLKVREGCCVDDISEGKEKFPIRVVNTIDGEKPPAFTYITEMIYPNWCKPLPPPMCACKKRCLDSKKCSCAVRNGGEIPFNNDGAIVKAKLLVYECSRTCKCPPSCSNRVSQKGMRFQLEIFKTEKSGWGVRSMESIPSGSFICEYIGEMLEDKEADDRSDVYLFDIGQNYNDESLWEGLSGFVPDVGLSSSKERISVEFAIDAGKYGNVGRFINHSCSPNLYAQNVLYDHDDARMPHIMFFASENIPPLQELTYDYNYTIGSLRDKDGKVKVKACYCGSSDCTGRLY